MYVYDKFDNSLVSDRVEQFREQVGRRLSGELTEDEFKPIPPDEWSVFATTRLYAARCYSLWPVIVPANAEIG